MEKKRNCLCGDLREEEDASWKVVLRVVRAVLLEWGRNAISEYLREKRGN